MKYIFIVLRSPKTHQWFWRARSTNGKKVGWSGEAHKKRAHVVKMAKLMAGKRKVFIQMRGVLLPV